MAKAKKTSGAAMADKAAKPADTKASAAKPAKTDAARTAGAIKLPKTVAGVKVPKELRRKGEALIDKANSPAGREAIAAGLTMVAAVAATRLRGPAGAAAAKGAHAAAAKLKPGEGGTGGGDFDGMAKAAVDAIQTWLVGKANRPPQ